MNKMEFLNILFMRLDGLPKDEVEQTLEFYEEIISDKVEDGLTEEEAVAQLGPISDIVSQVMSEISLSKIVRERLRPKRELRIWELVLIILGAPLWFPILIAFFAVFFSLYVVVWSIVISLYAIDISLGVSGLVGILGLFFYANIGNGAAATFVFGAGLACIGLAILVFIVSAITIKWLLNFTKELLLKVKKIFIRKEVA